MDIQKREEYIYNFEVSDIITGQKALCSLQAKVQSGKVVLYVCGQPYEEIKDTLNPQVETACQEFLAELQNGGE